MPPEVKIVATKTDSNTTETKNQKFYTVEKGDNLFAIAHKNNVTVAQLIEWNKLKDSNVSLGSQLIIPNSNQLFEDKNPINATNHLVIKGDNIKSIAALYNISQSNIKKWNNLKSTNLLVGQELIISKSDILVIEKTKTKKIDKNIAKDYLVRKGDSLFSISKKFPGVSIADLKKWNHIEDDALKPGMKLKING